MNYSEISILLSGISTIFAGIALFVSIRTHFLSDKRNIANARSRRDEKLIKFSRDFWEPLKSAYQEFRSKDKDYLPNEIEVLIERAEYPQGLHPKSDPSSYNINQGTSSQSDLWDFCLKVYPKHVNDDRDLITESIIKPDYQELFFKARSELGGFFDSITYEIGVKGMLKHFSGHKNLLTILTYLDIVHRIRRATEKNRGKEHLYKLVLRLQD